MQREGCTVICKLHYSTSSMPIKHIHTSSCEQPHQNQSILFWQANSVICRQHRTGAGSIHAHSTTPLMTLLYVNTRMAICKSLWKDDTYRYIWDLSAA